eukprot:jgi/Mesvir1/12795/Mv22845-RA.1
MMSLQHTCSSSPGVFTDRHEMKLLSSWRVSFSCFRPAHIGRGTRVHKSGISRTRCIREHLPSQTAKRPYTSKPQGAECSATSCLRVPENSVGSFVQFSSPCRPHWLNCRTPRLTRVVCQSADKERYQNFGSQLGNQAGNLSDEQGLKSPAVATASNDALINWIGVLFFISGFMGCAWGRFSAIYYVNVQHFSPSQIGIIEGTLPLLRCLAQPFWGAVSDKLRRRKPVALFTSLAGTSLLLLLAFPKSIATSFHRVWAINLAQASFSNGGILDAFALDALGPARALEYGKLRLFMAISWGIGSLSLALLSSRYGFRANFLALGILALLYNALVAIHIPAQMSSEQEAEPDPAPLSSSGQTENLPEGVGSPGSEGAGSSGSRYRSASRGNTAATSANNASSSSSSTSLVAKKTASRSKSPQLSALIPAFCTPSAFLFFTEVILMSAAVATVEGLLFVFLQEPRYGINASTSLCGTSVLVSILLEVPFFYYVKQVVDRVGMDAMWMIGSSAMALRCYLLAHVTSANVGTLVMLAEALHGIVFTALWAAGIERARVLAPEEFRTTGIALFQSAYGGVGIALGTFVGGYLMQRQGPRFLYLSMAAMCFAIFATRAARALWGLAFSAKGEESYQAKAA